MFKNMNIFIQISLFFGMYAILMCVPGLTEESICPISRSYIFKGKVVYYNETVCCDNYEMRANKCVECKLGFFRQFDMTLQICMPCRIGTFGKKCVFSCNCKQSERCNNMIGCVNGLDKNDDIEPTHASSTDTSSTDISKLKESTGFDGQKIIYTVIGCAMAVVIIICMSFMYVFFKLNKRISMSRNMPLASQPLSQSVNVLEEDEVAEMSMLDNDYEEIDETNMVNDNLNIDNTIDESETNSNSASTISPTEDDEGYLHPYHSLVHPKKMSNFVLDEHHSETDLRANVLLQNPYDHLQIPIKIPTTTGIESMEMIESSPTNSNKSGQEHVVKNTFNQLCILEETNIRIHAEDERKNLPAQQDQIDRLL